MVSVGKDSEIPIFRKGSTKKVGRYSAGYVMSLDSKESFSLSNQDVSGIALVASGDVLMIGLKDEASGFPFAYVWISLLNSEHEILSFIDLSRGESGRTIIDKKPGEVLEGEQLSELERVLLFTSRVISGGVQIF